MEILDYLKHLRRKALLLVVVPLATGAVPAALQLLTSGYAATAAVAAPTVVGGVSTNQYRGADAGKLFVANFTAALKVHAVLLEVSKETHKSIANLRANLSVKPIGTSTFMRVRYESPRRGDAEDVAQAGARSTLRFLFSTQVSVAKAQVDAAQHTVDQADADLVAFAARSGTSDPEAAYQAAVAGLAALQKLETRAETFGDAATVASLRSQLDAREAAVDALGLQAGNHQTLLDRKNQALRLLGLAQQRRQEAEVQLNGAGSDAIVPGHTGRAATVGSLAKAMGYGGAVGVFLAVALVVVLDVSDEVRRRPKLLTATSTASPAHLPAPPPARSTS